MRPRTPAELERQAKVFDLHIQGKTFRQIQAELGIGNRRTITEDILAEVNLRAEERAELREADEADQLARLDSLLREAAIRFDKRGTSALPTAAKVLEMRSKLLGLDAPIKIDAGLDEFLGALTDKDK